MTVRVRGCMRVGAALLSLVLLTACTIDLVDTPDTPGAPIAEPAPARLYVLARVVPLPDTDLVRVFVSATLDAGVADDGERRELATDRLQVGDRFWPPSDDSTEPRSTLAWETFDDYAPPVPGVVTVRVPPLPGAAEPVVIIIPVGVDLTPAGPTTLALTDDLVFHSQRPAHVTPKMSWRLFLASTEEVSPTRFELDMGSHREWPTEIRVPAEMMPDAPGELVASLSISMQLGSSAVDVPAGSPDVDFAARIEITHERLIERVSSASP